MQTIAMRVNVLVWRSEVQLVRAILPISPPTGSLHYLQENVDLMSQYIDLSKFKAIYVVDLCHSLCEVAKRKAKAKGWKNVHVIEADACQFAPPEGSATLVTFSYSLTSKLHSKQESICNMRRLTVA